MTQKSINLNDMFDEFNTVYGYEPVPFDSINLKRAVKLISDEVVETLVESDAEELNQPNGAKELTDILYITMQQMRAMGVDITACLEETHRSNLSKTVPLDEVEFYMDEVRERYPAVTYSVVDGRAVLRCGDTGKVIKPSCYSAAVITPNMF